MVEPVSAVHSIAYVPGLVRSIEESMILTRPGNLKEQRTIADFGDFVKVGYLLQGTYFKLGFTGD